MHPLNPRARWLILPALSMAFGGSAGYASALLGGNGAPGQFALSGAAFAGAAALATAMSPKLWVGYLTAPPLGVLGLAAVMLWSEVSASLWKILSGIVLHGPALFMVALLTAPVVVLHGIRMRRPTSWALVGLGFHVLAGTAAACGVFLLRGGWDVANFMFCLTLYVANGTALEVALRMNGQGQR